MDNRYKDRNTLKSYFQRGDVPTEEQFAGLIDSIPNIHDDGQVKHSPSDGIRLFPADGTGVVATVFASDPDTPGAAPLWRLALDGENGLNITDGAGETVMTIDRDRNVTVTGTVKAAKYLSDKDDEEKTPGDDTLKIKANGYWQTLPVEAEAGQEEKGCRVYRISACYQNRFSGKYSTCEAIVSHSDGRRRKVRSLCKHWWGWSGHVKIRWQRIDGKLYLQMKSKGVQSGSETIHCRIETIWTL